MSIRQLVIDTAAVLNWERETAKNTGEARKAQYSVLFSMLRKARPEMTDGDIVNAQNLLGVELKAKGWKADSIKVRRSEFGRIVEHIGFVPDECQSWKAALREIRIATVPATQRLAEELKALEEKMADLLTAIEEKRAELAEAQGDAGEEFSFSDEIEVEEVALAA